MIKKKWKITQKLLWILINPLKDSFLSEDEKLTKEEILQFKLPIKKDDKLIIIKTIDEDRELIPLIEVNIKGEPTFENLCKILEKELNKYIKVDNNMVEYFYKKIANFRFSKDRLELVKKYESGKLKPIDLLGDHKFFEGFERLGKSNYIIYNVGS